MKRRWIGLSLGAAGLLFVLGLLVALGFPAFNKDPSTIERYLDGLKAQNFDLVEQHLCARVVSDVRSYPGGFESAWDATLRRLDGDVDTFWHLRGSVERAALEIRMANGELLFYQIDFQAIEDQAGAHQYVLCPPGAGELLGRPYSTR